jgi:hypothetical protein
MNNVCKKNAYMSFRYGLAKHLKKEMFVDINNDADFATSREV